MRRWRVKETWKVTGWAFVEAHTREEAEMMLENGEGDFEQDSKDAEWAYDSTVGDVEEIP
jgi:hypothetical protein